MTFDVSYLEKWLVGLNGSMVFMSIPWALEGLLCIDTMALFGVGLMQYGNFDWLSGYR